MVSLSFPDRIEHDGLALRQPTAHDIPALVEACQDPEIPRYTRVPSPYGPAEAQTFIDRARAGRADGSMCWYLVTDPDDRLLGTCGMHHIDATAAELEVGYWLAQPARGKGIGSRSLTAVVQMCLHHGFERIVADVLVGNDASCRLLERVGFVHEGISRSVADDAPTPRGPKRIDLHWYSLLPSDPVGKALLGVA